MTARRVTHLECDQCGLVTGTVSNDVRALRKHVGGGGYGWTVGIVVPGYKPLDFCSMECKDQYTEDGKALLGL